MDVTDGRSHSSGRETAFVVAYFTIYVGYLFWHQEGELLHWISLVILPLASLAVIGRYASVRSLLRSIGFHRGLGARDLYLIGVLGIGFQLLQLMNARQRVELVRALQEPFGMLLPVAAFALLLGTVAVTEEVFFRGLLQGRLATYLRSHIAGVALTTIAFVIYHIPYAYLNPAWPSHGDFAAAVRLASVNGIVGGVVLGMAYWRSGYKLIVVILIHAFIDLIPATRLVHGLLAGRA